MMSSLSDLGLKDLFFHRTPLIDVRAPIEFQQGAVPHSINLPILDDDERAKVGTCYKQQGQEQAIAMGHQLVSGRNKEEKIKLWADYLTRYPRTQIFCFRAGMRSQTACQWLSERGFHCQPVEGGYKRMRRFFLSYLDGTTPSFYRLGGLTGSGKTRVLAQVSAHIDLEKLANHRGSAFGAMGAQPAQITFENGLSLELMRQEGRKILIEDESSVIGKCSIPSNIFQQMRKSPLLLLKANQEQRIKNIFDDYVVDGERSFFIDGLEKIKKRLSRKIADEISCELNRSFDRGWNLENHSGWISLLLDHYYDPLYASAIKRQQDQIRFEGNEQELIEYVRENFDRK